MLKNAIESAHDCFDSRKRRCNVRCNSEKALSKTIGLCGASNYGCFSSCPLHVPGFIAGMR
jgi:hypothetical protein